MAELALHPRLAHMLLKSVPLGLSDLACELAALLSERDILRGPAGDRMPTFAPDSISYMDSTITRPVQPSIAGSIIE